MTSFSRRSFVSGLLLSSAGAAFATNKNSSCQVVFPTEPRARIAVATYPFRASMIATTNSDRDPAKPGMDLAAFAKLVRTEFHVSGMEPLSTHFPSTGQAEILKLRAAIEAAGVFIPNIPVDDRVDLCSDDEGIRKASNARYRRWIDIAVTLRSPSIRVWIPKCSDVSDLPKAVRALRPTLDYAMTRNIIVNLENDDPVLASETRVVRAIRLAGTPYLRALPDFGNSLMGGDQQFNAQAVKGMFAYACNIAHVKDAEVIRGKRETVSLPELFGIAKAARYRGYYSMESDSDVDPFSDTKHLIRQSLTLI